MSNFLFSSKHVSPFENEFTIEHLDNSILLKKGTSQILVSLDDFCNTISSIKRIIGKNFQFKINNYSDFKNVDGCFSFSTEYQTIKLNEAESFLFFRHLVLNDDLYISLYLQNLAASTPNTKLLRSVA